MATKIFLNLPVRDLPAATAFYTTLGFELNPQFSNGDAACLVLSEHIHVMLLTYPFFQGFTKKPIGDAQATTSAIFCIDAESRAAVDGLVRTAVEAGGTLYNEPQDHGWMYAHSFADRDGHQWEVAYMDEAALAETMRAMGAATAAEC